MKRLYGRLLVAVLLIASIAVGALNAYEMRRLEQRVAGLQTFTLSQASTTARELNQTEQQLAATVTAGPKSQDQLLTTAVAKAAPAVVSIVVSKDVPNLQVSYVNPFGSDPLFKNFGIQIPVYEPKGSRVQKVAAGSGFLISHNGYILTNRHVVEDTQADYTVLLANGAQRTARVIYRDRLNDIAVIKIDGTYPTVAALGMSAGLKLGQSVVAIGNALGEYANSVSVGIISGMNRTVEATDFNGGAENLSGVLQTDASINPGNSGGPLVDLSGEVVGVNVATVAGGSNISFALPIDSVKSAVAPYMQ